MTNTDFFAAIADTKIKLRKELMESKQPIEAPKNFFKQLQKTDNKINKLILKDPDEQYKESLNEYSIGIERLKIYYKKFLTRRNEPSKQRHRKYLNDFDFRFEKSEDLQDFNRILEGKGDWDKIKIPHYHGPTGKWVSYYRTIFDYDKKDSFAFLVFKGSDYVTDVYLNGRHVLNHEGFFYSFEQDITQYLLKKDNVLVVKVENDITTLGENRKFGNKIYAATGIGWDDPLDGWHHCPPGGGIFDKVYIEQREIVHTLDAYVFPDIDNNLAKVNVIVNSLSLENTKADVALTVEPFNFDDSLKLTQSHEIILNNGENHYSYDIAIDNPKIWTNATPYLYTLKIKIDQKDEYELNFGMRKFHMDTVTKPYGTLYLNNSEIILRGANEMGHLQLCVMNEDYDQLIEDILIAKYCNMNYYRITQRPVQREIYEYCDMLGMMVQVDFPLFGQLIKSQIYEASRQIGEMERHIRRHPSVIMVSYINEPTDQYKSQTAHINLDREEMENWFDICDRYIRYENPQRVIKRVEGDYDPPTFEGLSDFHCYNMWYTNHALPIGDLYKGYLPATRKDWKMGCGEYGTEGLDNLSLMKKYYPKQWLPANDDDFWIPDKIIKAQTNSMHGDWFYEQDNINDWIKFSQNHQSKSVSLMTLALRRRSDYIVQTALHLLIDAYPSGWMKTVVGVDRVPKPAYFEFKKALKPLKLNFRSDRWSCYTEDFIDVESWILNDTNSEYKDIVIKANLYDSKGYIHKSYTLNTEISECISKPVGQIRIDTSDIDINSREKMVLKGELIINGEVTDTEVFIFKLFERLKDRIYAYPIGDIATEVVNTSDAFNNSDIDSCQIVIISDFSKSKELISGRLLANKPVLYILNEDNPQIIIEKRQYTISDKRMWKATYSPINQQLLTHFEWDDISFLYDSKLDKINFSAEYFIECDEVDDIYIFNYKKPSFSESTEGKKEKRPVLMKNMDGIFTTLNLEGRTGVNPAIDYILYDVIRRIL